jgi:uncharacterized protein YukE
MLLVEQAKRERSADRSREWFDGSQKRGKVESKPNWGIPTDSLRRDYFAAYKDAQERLRAAAREQAEAVAHAEADLREIQTQVAHAEADLREAQARVAEAVAHAEGMRRRWQDVAEAAHERHEAARALLAARRLPRTAWERTDPEQRFRELANKWYRETRTTSSLKKMTTHPAYLRILGMGPEAVPLLLRELERTRDHWLVALHAITGEEPASQGADYDEAVDAWLNWGRRRGHI